MDYLRDYLQNVVIFVLVVLGLLIFLRVFYPDTLALLPALGEVYTALNFWPLLVLALLVYLLPRRRR